MDDNLDDRFAALRRSVDDEIARARKQILTDLAHAVARMRAAKNQSDWHDAVLEAGRAFANDPEALELLGSLAALTAPSDAPAKPPFESTSAAETIDPNVNAAAQRFARVKIAEIQLYQSDAVRAGRVAGDLYHSLQHTIDEAREAFRERFLINGNGTTDYLHAEILHALANDDSTLLGPGYPGPLA